jgi:hypothetical protein
MHYEVGFYLLASLFLLYWLYKPEKLLFKRLGLIFLGIGFITFLSEIFIFLFLNGKGSFSLFQLIGNFVVGIFYLILWKFRKFNFIKFSPIVANIALLFTLTGIKFGNFTEKNTIFALHIITIVFSLALLILSCIFSIFRYITEQRLKKKVVSTLLGLPFNIWITLEHKFFFFGFIFLTLNLVVSFLLLNFQLKHLNIDLRILFTLMLWLYYGILFHLERLGFNLIKVKFPIFNILGCLLILLTLLLTQHSFNF